MTCWNSSSVPFRIVEEEGDDSNPLGEQSDELLQGSRAHGGFDDPDDSPPARKAHDRPLPLLRVQGLDEAALLDLLQVRQIDEARRGHFARELGILRSDLV